MPSFFRHCILVIFLVCTGCGFQPRGSVPLSTPLQNLYLETQDPYGQLSRNLRQYFRTSGVHLATSAKDASTVLHILKEEITQQLLSVSGTQQTRQYNLILTVTFQLENSKGVDLTPPQTVSETRTLTIQTSQILGGSNEASQMYTQMRLAIVYDIISRLSSQEITDILTKPHKTTP
jgi:LPS-assembly lipoprotein